MRLRYFYSAIFVVLFLNSPGITQQTNSNSFDCFSVIVGKDATADGSVMFAHNEDDWGDRVVNWYQVPSINHKAGQEITLKNGAGLNQASTTWSYLWLEMPTMDFSDSYMNEWGVTIASDACMSREKKGEITDGGIGYWLRRAMAERAKSARDAVKIGGALVEQYGYTSSGRTYCIADANEAWMMAVVKGKHWVAQRIPSDHVAIIPNYYTITKVDLNDSLNFLSSSDLIEYATKKKWYKPDKDGEFNFREVYSDPDNLENMGNIVRHWSAINMLFSEGYEISDEFPFSYKPKKKIELTDLFSVLRNHNEGSEYDESENYKQGNPHMHGRAICSSTTQYGFVAQLRNNLPKEIAYVLWLAPFRPCVNTYTQWYIGMSEIPEGYAEGTFRNALDNHFEPVDNVKKTFPDHEFLKYVDNAKKVDRSYGKDIKMIQNKISIIETDVVNNQTAFETMIQKHAIEDDRHAKKMISEYNEKQLKKAKEIFK